ncbi:MAG: DUF2384 domain-containing protein [Candidatus Thiodiazotropha sp. (ex Lucinoma kastoroae)]|nr:DUF2384 domain-containing protein [Candidatus Thiodiazotropha sp. (ex Rostrolucina anterorostrata)]MCU7848626.1 DUF2384 domain-containing protein [Candidatus Thiodiazotropha sp. (ex Lucinoma kastoroae)]
MTENAVSRKIEIIQEKGAMLSADIASIVGVRPETVSRWNQGRAYPQRDKEHILLELEYVVDLLSDFYEPDEARLWLFSRQKLLDGQRPADLIQAGDTDHVLAVINQLRDGVFL